MRQALFGGLPGEAVFQASFLPFWVTGSMTAAAAGYGIGRFFGRNR